MVPTVLSGVGKSIDFVSVQVLFKSYTSWNPAGRIETSQQDLERLFSIFSTRYGYQNEWGNWHTVRDHIMNIADGHVGVVRVCIDVLHKYMLEAPREEQKTAQGAMMKLTSQTTLDDFGRCFAPPTSLNETQRNFITETILESSRRSRDQLDFSDDEIVNSDAADVDAADVDAAEVDPTLVSLIRCGILRRTGGFSCPAARSYYYGKVYGGRPEKKPREFNDAESSDDELDVLTTLAISKMSKLRLRDLARGERLKFPKEASLQEILVEKLVSLLPVGYTITSELTTRKKVNDDGGASSGELDIYINGDLCFMLSLTRNGRDIGRKLGELEPDGKYGTLPCKAKLLVDFRNENKGTPQEDENRLSVVFEAGFSRCTIYPRKMASYSIDLAP